MTNLIVRLAIVTGLALFMAAGAAQATIIEAAPTAPVSFQSWVMRSAVPTPEETIRVEEAPCPTSLDVVALACTIPSEEKIWMDWVELETSLVPPRVAFYHELGHDFAYLYLGETGQIRFRQIVRSSKPWTDTPGYANGLEEDFANAYATCALGPFESQHIVTWRGWRPYSPAACTLIRRAWAAP
jgi:hypothetical protein